MINQFLGAHFINGAGQVETDKVNEFDDFIANAEAKHMVACQLVRAADGCRTDFVVLPQLELLEKLLVVENKDDLILILHERDFKNFSLHPLMKISTYLKIHGKFEV